MGAALMWAAPLFIFHDLRHFFQKIRQRLPQSRIVPLQLIYLFWVHAVGVGMDRHLIKVVGTPTLEGHQLTDIRKINMEHIAVEGHFPHIGTHVPNTSLGHALIDQLLFLRRHHHIQMDAAVSLITHESSHFLVRRLSGITCTVSSDFLISTGILLSAKWKVFGHNGGG